MRSLAWGARFVVHAEGLFPDPGEVTPALFGGHGAADLEKVFKHVPLTFDAGVGGFKQEFLDLGGELVTLVEERPDAGFAAGDALAEFGALRQVSRMQRGNTGEVLGGNLEFELKPGELGLCLSEQGAVAGGHGPIRGSGGAETEDGAEEQDDQSPFHGWEAAWA
jgi:hypothetical protein